MNKLLYLAFIPVFILLVLWVGNFFVSVNILCITIDKESIAIKEIATKTYKEYTGEKVFWIFNVKKVGFINKLIFYNFDLWRFFT